MATIGNDILQAKKLLLEGELVAIPTETVYGLAANALNPEAVTQIFVVKERPSFDPLIVHVASIDQAQQFITAVPEKAIQLARHFWPGPLTLVLPKQSIIPDIVTSGLSTVGIRCPDHDLTRQLLSELPFPLAAPSANPFGYVSPTTAEHVNNQLGHKIKYILDGGPCRIGLESTIVGFENDQAVIYRSPGSGHAGRAGAAVARLCTSRRGDHVARQALSGVDTCDDQSQPGQSPCAILPPTPSRHHENCGAALVCHTRRGSFFRRKPNSAKDYKNSAKQIA